MFIPNLLKSINLFRVVQLGFYSSNHKFSEQKT